jgi:hypothetical protein
MVLPHQYGIKLKTMHALLVVVLQMHNHTDPKSKLVYYVNRCISTEQLVFRLKLAKYCSTLGDL